MTLKVLLVRPRKRQSNPLVLPRRQPQAYLDGQGFTLTELLTASLITGIVVVMTGGILVSVLQANQREQAELEQRLELTRALEFMVDDVKEAEGISTTVTPRSGFVGVFELTRPDGVIVSYYTAPRGDRPWQGPRIVYRRSSDQDRAYALVDAISNTTPPCTGSGTVSSGQNRGIRVFVQADSQVKICLLGQLQGTATIPLETQAFARSRS